MIQDTFSTAHRIDNLRLSEVDRRTAEEFLHYGEFIADLCCRAGTNLRSAVALLSRSPAHHAK
jgi:hypothetical protein